jgi:acetyl-CoA synthetase
VTDRDKAQVSEAQIAVHWREEDYYYPAATSIAKANAADPAVLERFREKHFPECFKEYADPSELGPLLAHHP